MADVKDDIPHVERTANDQRQTDMYNANISRVELVNKRIRLIRLSLQNDGPPLRHLPGQYVDLHIPNIPTVGGFTITSAPQTTLLRPNTNTPSAPTTSIDHPTTTTSSSSPDHHTPYLDLAIQYAPSNPPAAYLWLPPPQILNAPVQIRIGGNFTYPPATLSLAAFRAIRTVVLVAGGVGINPIMSMLNAMDTLGANRLGGMPPRLRVLYSSKREVGDDGAKEEVLFEKRLEGLAEKYKGKREVDYRYRFFETGTEGKGRIGQGDLLDAVGDVESRKSALVYICGVPSMTDEFVDLLRATEGLDETRVLCEKWW